MSPSGVLPLFFSGGFLRKISRQEAPETTIPISLDLRHPRFLLTRCGAQPCGARRAERFGAKRRTRSTTAVFVANDPLPPQSRGTFFAIALPQPLRLPVAHAHRLARVHHPQLLAAHSCQHFDSPQFLLAHLGSPQSDLSILEKRGHYNLGATAGQKIRKTPGQSVVLQFEFWGYSGQPRIVAFCPHEGATEGQEASRQEA
jgi:hypothetical protein